jgi:hypothetical protein
LSLFRISGGAVGVGRRRTWSTACSDVSDTHAVIAQAAPIEATTDTAVANLRNDMISPSKILIIFEMSCPLIGQIPMNSFGNSGNENYPAPDANTIYCQRG